MIPDKRKWVSPNRCRVISSNAEGGGTRNESVSGQRNSSTGMVTRNMDLIMNSMFKIQGEEDCT